MVSDSSRGGHCLRMYKVYSSVYYTTQHQVGNFKELESLTDSLLNIACVYRLKIGAGRVGWEELSLEKLITGVQAPPIHVWSDG